MGDAGAKKRGGRRGLSVRLKVKTDYINGETDITALAKKHGTTRVTIWRWMKADEKAGHEWASRKEIRNAVVTDVTQHIAQRVAAEEGERVAAELLAIGDASRVAAEYVKDILQKARDGKVSPGEKQSLADVFNTIMSGYARFATTVREYHGLKPGQPTVAPEVSDDRGKRYVVAIEPAKAS
jgi:hypothetical protein